MRTIVIIIFCFATSSEAKPNPNITDILTSVDSHLAAIVSKHLKKPDFEGLTGYYLKCVPAKEFLSHLIQPCVATIGYQEMRKLLRLPAPRPWTHYYGLEPSPPPITIEEYYDSKEPKSLDCSLDNLWVTEKNVKTCIEYLDKKRPDIRAVYTKVFRLVGAPDVLDRPAVDRMVDILDKTLEKFVDIARILEVSSSDIECHLELLSNVVKNENKVVE